MTPVTGKKWLTKGVLAVGGASLFSDTSHEMVTSVLPAFLTSTLHAGPASLGAIEGVSDALTGLSKLAGGPLANDPRRRARLASGGYLGTAVATAAIGLTTAVWQVAILRALAWVSRGIRSPARDMLLTSLAPRAAWGRAFGVERAGDNLGAVIGPLAASVLVAVVGVRHTMLLAIVPGLLAAVAITVAGREARRALGRPEERRTLSLNLRELRSVGLGAVLAPIALFELGNLATTLLILRATNGADDGDTDRRRGNKSRDPPVRRPQCGRCGSRTRGWPHCGSAGSPVGLRRRHRGLHRCVRPVRRRTASVAWAARGVRARRDGDRLRRDRGIGRGVRRAARAPSQQRPGRAGSHASTG